MLRTNLSFIDVDQPSKAFVVTSSVPNEGKSTTAVNAAIAMASAGQTVLLIDGDLRRPQVAELLDLEPTVGLTTVLVGRAVRREHPEARAFRPRRAHGRPTATQPGRAAAVQRHARPAREARERYDVTIIDAPPLLPVTDAAVMASQTDGAVLVVRHGKTTKDQLSGAVDRLPRWVRLRSASSST